MASSSNSESDILPVPPENEACLSRVASVQCLSPPDTEENVLDQSKSIFLNYCYQSYHNDSVRDEVDSLPAAQELINFSPAPTEPAAEIGRQLARLGDEINEQYADTFDGMISNLNLDSTDDGGYEAFSCIARRMFADGTTSWSRILFLLSFGYRMAIHTLRTQAARFSDFLTRIVSFVCRFLVTEKIVKWIADHGGWQAALSYVPGASINSFLLVSGMATLSVFAVFMLHKYL